jgi:2-keto-4-pentenoate hydratase/2-oxohepta-3-ene-1,7-dioic acid hydratase in catechol pathway
MRIIRYLDPGDHVKHAFEHPDGNAIELEGDILSGLRSLDRPAEVRKILAPIAPSQILGIGLNYRRHAEETRAKIPDFPVLFGKGLNALQNPGDPILIPTHLPSKEVDYECELAVVIKKACKNVSRRDALRFVLGYTCANDVSARDWQKKKGGGQWSRGKSFDSFCPLGPCLVTADEIPDPSVLAIRTMLNGETVQDCNTGDMIFDVPALIEFLSGSTTLLAGTVILTGTPHGVGMAAVPPRWLAPGDIVSVEIERIGILTNPIQWEPAPRSDPLDA